MFRVHSRVFISCISFHILQKISCPKEFGNKIFEVKKKVIFNSLTSSSSCFLSEVPHKYILEQY